MYRLGSLESGDWRPRKALEPDCLRRIGSLAAEVLATGRRPDQLAAVYFVPGRIEVLGKHTDYAGGRGLVVATEQGFWMLASPREDSSIRMVDRGRSQTVEFCSDNDSGHGQESWIVYPQTVAQCLARDLRRDLVGADIAFESDLPASAGLSSSSVFVVSTFMALAGCNHLDRDPLFGRHLPTREHLAAYLGAIENGSRYRSFAAGAGVGTHGGNQDHTAILCARQGEISQYRYLPTVLERGLALPPGLVFGVAASGVRAQKTGATMGDYNRISNLAARLEELWESHECGTGASLGSIVGQARQGAARLAAVVESSAVEPGERDVLQQRLSQFRLENEEIIPAAGDAMAAGDLIEFGRCVDRSMRLATELLGNQIEETVWLASRARELGAVAASAFGAGFGGAVWALVPADGVDCFLESWSASYRRRYPEHRTKARFLWTGAGGPAVEL